ncbi:uncharacterized protein PHALS_09183 [Plasmopara halstedii]|uniref:Uncharacterized protein n=1 Tax=Plasmopara halstedii TaxID=4781 RepID=A0A0P1AFD5_PLAHL|nr:uncharacterized protein PHALS_09183 [Plasmopara halstedii]CEG39126.1 hypothetical protein PHALS_09183 [Plasmopara halstedii]|eukprot:XP_024575495.1 hypothetical protein PHALS_09183 [Plasmopara halstedii]
MEDSVPADNEGQQPTSESIMKELIAYSVSWDPLMKVLQALGKSIARHQKTQQGNDSIIKKLQDQVVQQEQQVAALRDDVTRAHDDKTLAAAAIEAMQNRVGELQSQLEEVKELAPGEGRHLQRLDDTSGQKQGAMEGKDNPTEIFGQENIDLSKNGPVPKSNENDNLRESNLSRENSSSRINNFPQIKKSSVANTSDGQAFVTVMDLAEAKRELTEEWNNTLAKALGHNTFDKSHNSDIASSQTEHNEQTVDNGVSGIKPQSPSANEMQPSGTSSNSSKELEYKVELIQALQDVLNTKLSEHDLILNELNSRMGKLDDPSSQETTYLASPQSSENPNDTNGDTAGNSLLKKMNETNVDLALTMTSISNDIKELKAVQDNHDLRLQKHDKAVDKHSAEIKALTDSLDDISVQQQTISLMFTSGQNNSRPTGSTAFADVPADETVHSVKIAQKADAGAEVTSLPQLDLSLVFTKIADLRRSTDDSLQSLQQAINDITDTSQAQQGQWDALINSGASDKLMRAQLVEARLAMQKELLARNQAYQDHLKPQLIEWRNALELIEEKLVKGMSDDETLYTLQQMQRGYHRTLLSATMLATSPLIMSETLQTLSDEMKQLRAADRSEVMPSRQIEHRKPGEQAKDGINKADRGEEFLQKLLHLVEEIDATVQANRRTEKKNDPLMKGLDAMREKLELLWSIWHRNYNVNSIQPSEVVAFRENSNSNIEEEGRQSILQGNQNGLREIEMRLSGAVRRITVAEEEIERLNLFTAAHTAIKPEDTNMVMTSRRSSSSNSLQTELVMNEVENLRRDMHDEIANLLGKLEENIGKDNGSSNNTYHSSTSLVLPERRNLVETAANHGNAFATMFPHPMGQGLDNRVMISPEDQKQFYDKFMQEVTKNVLSMLHSEKGTQRGPGVGGAASANVNFRLLLDNFAQKVDDRLEDAQNITAEQLARLRKELIDQLKVRFEVAVRDIRGELMLLQPVDGDSTAMGTKPVMCVACSRPVPVSSIIREAGSLTTEMANVETTIPSFAEEFEYDRPDDDYVFRAGFKMPANDRKLMTLPFLTTAMRSKMVVNKPEGKRRRPPRQSHLNRVDNVIREAMELDRASQGRGVDAQ